MARKLQEKETEGKRSRKGKIITVAGNRLATDLGSLVNFAKSRVVTNRRSLCTRCSWDRAVFLMSKLPLFL